MGFLLIRFVAAVLVLAGVVVSPQLAWAQSVPVLSRTQVDAARAIEKIVSLRMEPRRGGLAVTVAAGLEDDLRKIYLRYFPNTPIVPHKPGTPIRRIQSGTLICRLMTKDRDGFVALFNRCTLGNLSINIILREDLQLTRLSAATDVARQMVEDAVRRVAYSYRKARGQKPVWSPEP